MKKFFQSESFRRWWCRFRHSASRTGEVIPTMKVSESGELIPSDHYFAGMKRYRCDRCNLEWDHVQSFPSPM